MDINFKMFYTPGWKTFAPNDWTLEQEHNPYGDYIRVTLFEVSIIYPHQKLSHLENFRARGVNQIFAIDNLVAFSCHDGRTIEKVQVGQTEIICDNLQLETEDWCLWKHFVVYKRNHQRNLHLIFVDAHTKEQWRTVDLLTPVSTVRMLSTPEHLFVTSGVYLWVYTMESA
jgi:hypothetical protein